MEISQSTWQMPVKYKEYDLRKKCRIIVPLLWLSHLGSDADIKQRKREKESTVVKTRKRGKWVRFSFYNSWHSLGGVSYLFCVWTNESFRGRGMNSGRAWLALCSMFHCCGLETEREWEIESIGEIEGWRKQKCWLSIVQKEEREEKGRRKGERGWKVLVLCVEWEETTVREREKSNTNKIVLFDFYFIHHYIPILYVLLCYICFSHFEKCFFSFFFYTN